MDTLKETDVVALTDELPAKHAVTGASLTLLRGQVGAVVAELGAPGPDGSHPAYEVEFVDDRSGRTYAVATVPAGKLLLLHQDAPALAAR